MKIKEMTLSERPREKMKRKGPSSLSDAELLAVMLRTGTRGTNVVDMSRKLLDSAGGSLEILSGMSMEKLCCVDGMGPGKALALSSAVEFGRRLASCMISNGKIVMDTPADAARLLSGLYTTDAFEECWCLMLKRSRRVINSVRISQGGESMTQISVKTIVRRALDSGAAAVILSHNHPGGDPHPSAADVKQTMRLKKALDTFDISLMDHIIISGREYYSFSTQEQNPF